MCELFKILYHLSRSLEPFVLPHCFTLIWNKNVKLLHSVSIFSLTILPLCTVTKDQCMHKNLRVITSGEVWIISLIFLFWILLFTSLLLQITHPRESAEWKQINFSRYLFYFFIFNSQFFSFSLFKFGFHNNESSFCLKLWNEELQSN